MMKIFILFFCILFTSSTFSQIAFNKIFGSSYDYPNAIHRVNDGYVITSIEQNGISGSLDFYLIKLDFYGDTIWTKIYGGSQDDIPYKFEQTSDGGYIIVGYTRSFGAGSKDIFLIKTNYLGDTLWTKTYGNTSEDEGGAVSQTSDGGYIIGGNYTGMNASENFCLIKTDFNGDTLWSRSYGGYTIEILTWLQETSDFGYILAGFTSSFGNTPLIYIVKTNSIGDTLWTRTYGGLSYNYADCIQQTSDGGYIILGHTESYGAGQSDFYLTKIDNFGNLSWSKTYGGSLAEYGHCVKQTLDGGFILVGSTQSFGILTSNIYLVKTDALGDTLWTRVFDNGLVGRYVEQTPDTGYIISGFAGGILVIKTDANGNTGCYENSTQTIVTSPSTIVGRPPTILYPFLPIINSGGGTISSGVFISTLCLTLSVKESKSNCNFNIYPNPANDILFIESCHELTGQIKIFNLFGEVTSVEFISGFSKTINLKLKPGFYFLNVSNESENLTSKFFVE